MYTIKSSKSQGSTNNLNLINQEIIEPEPSSNVTSEGGNDPEIDLSEDICSMFGMSPTINEVSLSNFGGCSKNCNHLVIFLICGS